MPHVSAEEGLLTLVFLLGDWAWPGQKSPGALITWHSLWLHSFRVQDRREVRSTLISEEGPPQPVSERGQQAGTTEAPFLATDLGPDLFIDNSPGAHRPWLLGLENTNIWGEVDDELH